MHNNSKLEDDCKVLLGFPPYDTGSNISKGDNYYSKSLEIKYGRKAVEEMCHKLESIREENRSAIMAQLAKLHSGKSKSIKKPSLTETSVAVVETKPTVNKKITKKVLVIPKDIQDKVDEYLSDHAMYKELEKNLSQLKAVIEPYMKENNLTSISSKNGGSINIIDQNKAPVTSRFTKYPVDGVTEKLSLSAKRKCLVKKVDGDILEAMVTIGEVPKSVLSLKVYNVCGAFTVKKS